MSTAAPPPQPETMHPVMARLDLRTVGRLILGTSIAAALIYWLMPLIARSSWTEILAPFERVSWLDAIWLLVLLLASLVAYSWLLTGAVPGLSHVRALQLNTAGTSISNLLPGGGAAGAGATYMLLRTWGFSRAIASSCLVVTWLWNMLGRALLPVLGIVLLLAVDRRLPAGVITGAAIALGLALLLLACFGALMASTRATRILGGVLGRVLGWVIPRIRRQHAAGEFVPKVIAWRSTTMEVVRTGWRSMSLGVLGFLLGYFVLFWQAAEILGLQIGMPELFGAYAVGRLIASIGITPGGVGVSEAGTAAVLTAFGADPVLSTATTLLFSLYTFVLQIPIGAIAWLTWWLEPGHGSPAEEAEEALERLEGDTP